MSNLEADWGEVKVYKQIPMKVRNVSAAFDYSFRSSNASFYLCEAHPEYIVKHLNFDKPGFVKNYGAIKALLKGNKTFIPLKAVDFKSNWAPALMYEKAKGEQWKRIAKEERLDYMLQLKTQLRMLFDNGYYFKNLNNFNLMVDNDKLQVLGWDNITPIETNQNFLDCYPWAWII